MRRSLWRFSLLGYADQRILLRAFVWLAAVDLALRFAWYRQRLGSERSVDIQPGYVLVAADLYRAQHHAYWLMVASRHHVVRARCLHRSLVLHHWLRREGVPSDLRIGVRKDNGALRAHAWVELGGQAVSDPPTAVAAFRLLARGGDSIGSFVRDV